MTTFSTGREAEEAAAEYLVRRGFEILEHNWRTRWCEIDVIARKAKTVYFVEVKYRRSEAHGSGLEYITRNKLRHMAFAAKAWVYDHGWRGDYCLSAIEVSGATFDVTDFVESIS